MLEHTPRKGRAPTHHKNPPLPLNHSVLVNLKEFHNSLVGRKNTQQNLATRMAILRIMAPNFSLEKLQRSGWKIQKNIYCSARKTANDKMFSNTPVKRGRKALDQETVDKIKDFWLQKDVSQASMNYKILDDNHKKVHAYRMLKPAIHILKECYLRQQPYALSTSTILKYKPKHVIPAKKHDGICPHCQKRKNMIISLQQEFPNACKELDIKSTSNPSVKVSELLKEQQRGVGNKTSIMKNPYSKEQLEKKVAELEVLEKHFQVKERINQYTKTLHDTWPPHLARIIIDWKKPVVGGHGGEKGEENSSQCHNLWLANVFGACLQHSDFENVSSSKPINRYTTIFTLNSEHTSFAAIQHLENIISKPEFQEVLENPKIKELHLSMDNAAHFISREMMAWFFTFFPSNFPHIKKITWAPLAANHGKTDLDRHFGTLELYMRQS